MTWYRWQAGELRLDLRIQPRASRDEIVGPHGDRLRVRITAPPVDGKANAHLVKYLAKRFGVTRAAVKIISGESGRDKSVAIAAPRHLPSETGVTAPDDEKC